MRTHAVLALVMVAMALAAEESATVEMLVDPVEGADAVVASSFTEVKGFELKEGGTEVSGKTKAECEALCLADSTCKSYSFDPTPQSGGTTPLPSLCYYTKEALNFDPADSGAKDEELRVSLYENGHSTNDWVTGGKHEPDHPVCIQMAAGGYYNNSVNPNLA